MNKTGNALRITAIVFMGLTAAMNLVGGVGTTCVAFSSNVVYRMAFIDLMDYRWLYQGLVVTTVLIGIAGVWAVIKLVRGGPTVYRDALIVLVIGTILGGTQFIASLTLRGKATPANVKFFTNLFTLIIFLLFKAPGIREKVDFSHPGGKAETTSAAGMAAIIAGLLMLTVFHWAAPSHTYNGENWVYVFEMPLIVVGTVLTLGGIGALLRVAFDLFSRETAPMKLELSDSK